MGLAQSLTVALGLLPHRCGDPGRLENQGPTLCWRESAPNATLFFSCWKQVRGVLCCGTIGEAGIRDGAAGTGEGNGNPRLTGA